MELPQGLLVSLKDQDKVCLLREAIYGLKRASRAWYTKIHVFLIGFRMIRSEADHNLYFFKENDLSLIVLIYVDDLLIAGNHTSKISTLEREVEDRYEMSKLGSFNFYIRVEFIRFPQGMLLV